MHQTRDGSPAATTTYVTGDQTASPVVPASKTVSEPGGVSATTTIDSEGRPVSVVYSDATPECDLTYDKLGRVTKATGAVDTTRAYDTLGEVTSVTRAGRTVSYSYSAPGRVATLTYPNGKHVTRSYDSAGRWSGVTDWDNQSTTFSWTGDGNIAAVSMPNGTATTRDFNADGQINKVTYQFPGGGWPIAYSRGTGGELTGASQLGGSASWAYDPAAQLATASSPPVANSFDPAGNPTTVNSTTQTFDASNQLCWSGTGTGACAAPPAGATSYTYNPDGQRVTAGANTYSYDATGMMTAASQDSSSYTYAADGLRTTKTVGGATTTFAWDDTTSVPELIQDGDDYYLFGPDGMPFERVGADPTRWLFTDATGSVTVSTDTTATITGTRTYDAWGNTTNHTGDPVSLGWQAQYQDTETGLYYLWHRYYDPTTAQFTSPDPLYPVTGSRYGYAANDPVNGSDPTGLCGFLGNGPCTPGGIAKEATNDTISVATGGHANCVRYATCSGSTKNAYYSAGDVVDFAARNRGTIATGVATVGCLIPGVGWVSCAGLQAGAYGFRAQQRIEDEGFGNSLGENAVDLAFATAFFAVGGLPEWFGSFKGMGPWSQEVVRLMEAGPDIIRSIFEHCDG